MKQAKVQNKWLKWVPGPRPFRAKKPDIIYLYFFKSPFLALRRILHGPNESMKKNGRAIHCGSKKSTVWWSCEIECQEFQVDGTFEESALKLLILGQKIKYLWEFCYHRSWDAPIAGDPTFVRCAQHPQRLCIHHSWCQNIEISVGGPGCRHFIVNKYFFNSCYFFWMKESQFLFFSVFFKKS